MCIISQCCNDGGRRNCNRSVPYQHIRCNEYTIIGIVILFQKEAVDYVLEHSRADIVVVGDSETLAKVGEILQFLSSF